MKPRAKSSRLGSRSYNYIADHTEPDSEQRQQLQDEFLVQMREKGCDPDIILRIGELTLRCYEQARRIDSSEETTHGC